jgi:hypothetical protein
MQLKAPMYLGERWELVFARKSTVRVHLPWLNPATNIEFPTMHVGVLGSCMTDFTASSHISFRRSTLAAGFHRRARQAGVRPDWPAWMADAAGRPASLSSSCAQRGSGEGDDRGFGEKVPVIAGVDRPLPRTRSNRRRPAKSSEPTASWRFRLLSSQGRAG